MANNSDKLQFYTAILGLVAVVGPMMWTGAKYVYNNEYFAPPLVDTTKITDPPNKRDDTTTHLNTGNTDKDTTQDNPISPPEKKPSPGLDPPITVPPPPKVYYQLKTTDGIAVLPGKSPMEVVSEVTDYLLSNNTAVGIEQPPPPAAKISEADLWNGRLNPVKIGQSLDCICAMRSVLEYQDVEREGEVFTKVSGQLRLKFMNTSGSIITTHSLSLGGSGADQNRSRKSMLKNLRNALATSGLNQKLTPCGG